MTLESEHTEQTFLGNGVTTIFPIPFKFFDEEIIVYKEIISDPYIKGKDYNIEGGNVVFVEAPAKNTTLTIARDVPLRQEVTFIEGEAFPAKDFEYSLDRLYMALQELKNYAKNGAGVQEVRDKIDALEKELSSFKASCYTKDEIDEALGDYYTKTEVDSMFGDVNSVLDSINGEVV